MANTCFICRHPKKEQIEKDISSGIYPDTQIGAKYGVHRKTVSNHKMSHMLKLVKKEIKAEVKEAEADLNQLNSLADKMDDVESMVRGIYESAKLNGADNLALQAARELRSQLETATKVATEIRNQAALKNQLNWKDEWQEVRVLLDEVFEKYPKAGELFDKKLLHLGSSAFPVS